MSHLNHLWTNRSRTTGSLHRRAALLTAVWASLQACTGSDPGGAASIVEGGAPSDGGAAGSSTAGGAQETAGAHEAGGGNTGAGGAEERPARGFITWTYGDEPVGMYVPESASGPLPIVLFLHPCHNPPVYPEHWIISALNDIEPCVVLLPSRPEGESAECAAWGGTYDASMRPGLAAAIAELDRIVAEYDLAPERQYVYGESMGAEGVFRLLVDAPARFAGAVAVAGYTVDAGASEMAETPLWIVHGEADSISGASHVQTIYQSILDAGGTEVHYTEYAGLDHVPAIERARRDSELLEWLLSQRRE